MFGWEDCNSQSIAMQNEITKQLRLKERQGMKGIASPLVLMFYSFTLESRQRRDKTFSGEIATLCFLLSQVPSTNERRSETSVKIGNL